VSVDLPVYVLDSFAMLAYLDGEPGMARVRAILGQALQHSCRVLMSVINLGEVVYITHREMGLAQAQAVLAAIEQLPLEILPATRESVLAAAHIKANHRIAYADAFAVAGAQESGGVAVTGDPEFQMVEGLVPVEWLDRVS
jgi:predicted nucleic acid-binding protein